MDRGRFIVMALSGVRWYPQDPSPDDVRYADQRVLSKLKRWGHGTAITVAEHCVRVARYVLDQHLPAEVRRRVALQALTHDGHEVYPPYDFPGPLLQGDTPEACVLRNMERRAATAYRVALGLPLVFDPLVHVADMVILATEARDCMPPDDAWKNLPAPLPIEIEPWSEEHAWDEWERMYRDLGGVVV